MTSFMCVLSLEVQKNVIFMSLKVLIHNVRNRTDLIVVIASYCEYIVIFIFNRTNSYNAHV